MKLKPKIWLGRPVIYLEWFSDKYIVANVFSYNGGHSEILFDKSWVKFPNVTRWAKDKNEIQTNFQHV